MADFRAQAFLLPFLSAVPSVNIFADLALRNSVPLLNFTFELIASAIYGREVVICEIPHLGCGNYAPGRDASGWSSCRVGLAPTGKRRLVTAHTPSGHSGSRRSLIYIKERCAKGHTQILNAFARGAVRPGAGDVSATTLAVHLHFSARAI